MKRFGIAVSVGILVAVCVFLQILITGFFEVNAETWPMLMAPAMVAFLGSGKKGIRSFYQQFVVGMLAACAFILLEHSLAPVMGVMGILIPLAVLVALVVGLGFVLPNWSGGAAFIAFCAGTILTSDILEVTFIRLIVLFVGASVFLFAEHYLVKLIMGKSKPEQPEQPELPEAE